MPQRLSNELMYFAEVLLWHYKNATQVETLIGLSHLHVFAPKNPKIAKKVVLGFDLQY